MPAYANGKSQDVPGQVTYPGDASKGYLTAEDGVIYPNEKKITVNKYLSEEGSMGFERNQGVVRDSDELGIQEILNMGQHKLQKISENALGSHAI